jgi:TRAP-type C4-dicarboxylate transport system permease small subunit
LKPDVPQSPASQQRAAPWQGVIDLLARCAAGGAIAALLGLVAVQAWQVFARYVLNDSPSWTEPLTVLLLATVVGLGAAVGVHERRHFAFALLADALPSAARAPLRSATHLVTALIGMAMAGWGTTLFADGLHIPAAGARLPQSAGYLPLALGGALIALFALHQALFAASRDDLVR